MSRPLYIIMEERDLTKRILLLFCVTIVTSFSYVYLAETTSWLRANSIVAALENDCGCSV
jgi:hypothetical protein